jgi:hypothetical protein
VVAVAVAVAGRPRGAQVCFGPALVATDPRWARPLADVHLPSFLTLLVPPALRAHHWGWYQNAYTEQHPFPGIGANDLSSGGLYL